jgi:hypothetical protein
MPNFEVEDHDSIEIPKLPALDHQLSSIKVFFRFRLERNWFGIS